MERNLTFIMSSIPESSTVNVNILGFGENKIPKGIEVIIAFDYYKTGKILRRDTFSAKFA